MNKWQRLNIAVLDVLVDNGQMTGDAVVETVWTLDPHFTAPRVRRALDELHNFGALLATSPPRRSASSSLLYVVNRTAPAKLRAVWRGESIVERDGDESASLSRTL